MKSKTSKIIPVFIASILAISTLVLSPVVYAADDVCSSNAAQVVKDAAGCGGNNNALPNIITVIINSIIAVSGLVAVIFIVVGGVNYVTSSGDANKVKKAKDTILYACIGLIICALAFAIVNWVINSVLK